MRKKEKVKKRRKLRTRIDTKRPPTNPIRNNLEQSATPIEEEAEKENLEEKPISFVQRINQLSQQVQMLVDEEEHNEKQYQLLKMMYMDDVDSIHAVNTLGISENELNSLVEELVELGFLRYTSDDEVELTRKGIKQIKSQTY